MNLTAGNSTALSATPYVSAYQTSALTGTAGRDMQGALGMFTDQFDRSDTSYVLAHDAQGRVSGCVRMMPTDRPYLLSQLYPQLFESAAMAAPCSAQVWELSRFSASDFNGRSSAALSQLPVECTLSLLRHAAAHARLHGALRLITLASIGFERILARSGLQVHRLGPPAIVDGHPVFACWIELA